MVLRDREDASGHDQRQQNREQNFPDTVGTLALNFSGGCVDEHLKRLVVVLVGQQPDRQQQVFVRHRVVATVHRTHDLRIAADPLADFRMQRRIHALLAINKAVIQFYVVRPCHQSCEQLLIERHNFQ